jgi:hypothetical protein
VPLRDALGRAAAALRRAAEVATAQPPPLGRVSGEAVFLALAVAVQWLVVAGLVLSVTHNGWLFYQGGDQTYFWTTAWLLSEGHLPESLIGYAWPVVQAPIALAAGPDFLEGLPALVLLQTLVLLPLGLVALYGTAKRLAGARLARVAAIGWAVVPVLVIPLWVERYHERYVEQFLPQALGLTGLGDFPSMVLLLCAAYLVVRAMDEGTPAVAALAGLVTGFAIGVKPANALFLAAPFAGLALARRFRAGAAFALALAPALLTLAVWKQRGLGELPLFALEHARAAAALAGPPAGLALDRYLDVDWGHLGDNLVLLREYFWSRRLVEFLPLAGFLGAWRCSFPKAALLGSWLALFVVFKGSSRVASVDDGSFFRLLMPAWPAYFLLGLSVVALVPVLGGRLRGAGGTARESPRRLPGALVAAVVVLGLVPLVLVASLPRLQEPLAAREERSNLYLPEDTGFALAGRRAEGGVELSWRREPADSASSFFRVYRAPAGGDGIACRPRPGGAVDCVLEMEPVGATTEPRFAEAPPPGAWVYRVAVAAGHLGTTGVGDSLLLSAPASVSR